MPSLGKAMQGELLRGIRPGVYDKSEINLSLKFLFWPFVALTLYMSDLNDHAKKDDYRWLLDSGPAPDGPGVEPRWTSSKKDTVCTAYSASSTIWFTVSHGTVNEVYFPTIDRPQMRDMELIFTDEETFVHEDKRDLSYDFEYLQPDSLACRVSASALDGRYTVTKEYISDPHHAVVLMNVRIGGSDEALLKKLKCYVLLAPHLDGGGAGNSAQALDVSGKRTLLAWKNGYSLALGVTCGFSRSSCGYVGTSDGYQDLTQHGKMTWTYGSAMDGNVACMGEIEVADNREFTVGIGLGDGHHAAISSMMQSLATPYSFLSQRFLDQWKRAVAPIQFDQCSTDGGKLSRTSHSVIYAHEDKRFPGAFIASASIPWGASKGDNDLGGYHLVWTRDMVQSATALLASGRTENALRALIYLACTQRPNGGFAQNFWVDGEAYWSGIQLDEVAFPIILAWRLWKMDGLGEFDVKPFVERAAGFLVRYAPITQQERWEENAGYSPSTLAAVISGLVCAADLLRSLGSADLASFLETYADWIESHLDEWTTTDDGVLMPGVKQHYMRIRPPAPGEAFHNDDIPVGFIHLANRGPNEVADFDAKEICDQGFLELVRYGIRRADDPLITESLKVIDHCLKYETPFGPAWRRYNHDGYGQKKDGGPYEGWGQGRCWPLLGGERAHYELAAGNDVTSLISTYEKYSSIGGMLPEQVWDHDDMPEEGMYLGQSAGSAQPLVWAHAEYLKLLRSHKDGKIFDTISVVEERYGVEPGKRSFKNSIEIYQVSRPIYEMASGFTLRVVDREAFEVVYSGDAWKTTNRVACSDIGFSGFLADIGTSEGAESTLTFTLHWTGSDGGQERWLGHDVEIKLTATGPATMPAGTRPLS
jgi:glucoamylase